MKRSLSLVLLAAAACSRTWSAPNDVPRIDSIEPAAGSFAGETVVLRGSGFSPTRSDDVVRFGTLQAEVRADDGGSPTPTSLEVVVPDLGSAAQDVDVSVSVANGASSRPVGFHFRGPGHPPGLSIELGQDLSPTPTSVSVMGDKLAATLLRNNAVAVYLPGLESAVALPALPGHLITDSRLLPGIDPSVVLWDAEYNPFAMQQGSLAVRSTMGQLDRYALALVTPELPVGSVQASGLPLFGEATPTIYGLDVLAGADRSGPGVFSTPVPGVSAVADDLLFDADAGVFASEIAAFGTDDSGALSLTRVEIVAGNAPIAQPPVPVALPQAPRLFAYSARGDGGTVFFADIGPQVTNLGSIDAATGAVTRFDAPLPFPAFGMVANQEYVAVASQLSNDVAILRLADGGFVGSVSLASSPFSLSKDELPPNHFYAAQFSPPAAVEIDPEAPRIVRSLSLTNGIGMSSVSPDGESLALTCRQIPCMAVVDTRSLHEDDGGFQHATEAPGFDLSYVASTAWLPADGGYELCGAVGQIDPDGGVLTAYADGGGGPRDVDVSVRCGPPDAFFSAARDVVPHVVGSPDAADVPALDALDGGTLRLFYRDHVVDCANGTCTDQGSFPAADRPGTLAFTPGGDALRLVAQGLEELQVGGGQVKLRPIASSPEIEPGARLVVVDQQGTRAVVVQHGTLIFDLASGLPDAVAFYLSDDPVSAAFSPDGKRLYIGTALGHLDEYDASALPPPQGNQFPPSLPILRSVVSGFPIFQIAPSLDGSRLVLTDLGSDRLFVAQ